MRPRRSGAETMAAQRKQSVDAKKTIGIIGYDGVQALDIVGPVDSFSIASAHLASERHDSGPAYEVLVLGPSRCAFVAESGIVIRPHRALEAAPPLDTVIVPGGRLCGCSRQPMLELRTGSKRARPISGAWLPFAPAFTRLPPPVCWMAGA